MRNNRRIAFFLGHPAHYHLFKYVMEELEKAGYEVDLLVKRKDNLEELLQLAGYHYYIVRRRERTATGKLRLSLSLISMELRTMAYIIKRRPSVIVGTYAPVLSHLLGIPFIVCCEDDTAVVPRFARTSYPYATAILAPTYCDGGRWDTKMTKYNGFQKLAYLHPNRFSPDRGVVDKMRNGSTKPYVLMRFTKLRAHHDKGIGGMSNSTAIELTELLKTKYDVYISSERPLCQELETYRLNILPTEIHHWIAFAEMFIGDSQSMSVEAAMLGTPSIRFSGFAGKIGVLNVLEKKYGLTIGIPADNPNQLFDTVKRLANTDNLKDIYNVRRNKMLQEQVDVTEFYVNYIKRILSNHNSHSSNSNIKRILFDVGHPAHVHLFKNIARQLQKDGHEIFFTCRKQPISQDLLKKEGFEYRAIGRKHTTLIGKALMSLHQALWMYGFVKRKHIDVGVSSGIVLTMVSRLTRMRAIVMDDDDDAVEPLTVRFGHRHAYAVMTPAAIRRSTDNAVYYNGTHELAYLHPQYFHPDPSVLDETGVKEGERFFVMRFVAFHGHHDINEGGLSLAQKMRTVKLLSGYGRVIITSETPLPEQLEPYRMAVPTEKMHSLLSYASLYVGDSQTMTSEAAILGVPAIKCNTFAGRLSVPNELEENYGLCYSYRPDQFDDFLRQVEQIAKEPSNTELWAEKRLKFLSDKIDVARFVAQYLEKIPTQTKNRADFTPGKYRELLQALCVSGIDYSIGHDVDAHPFRSVRIAKMEKAMGITSTYYFRVHEGKCAEQHIRAITALGHNIGYHYESLARCHGNMQAAYDDFCRNLEALRRIAPVTNIRMHGSPLSKYNSLALWEKYDYRTLGITCEPFLDIDYSQTLYLSDTGRMWDGEKYSVRDYIPHYSERWREQGQTFHSTDEIIAALTNCNHPIHTNFKSIYIVTHPQRWLPIGLLWMNEFVGQNIKNIVKRWIKR